MTAEPAQQLEALQARIALLLGVFRAAGCEEVAPAIIQPADLYLDVIGEELRGRSYVFTDPEGEEFCLRPDMTVPACRLYLERHPSADVRALLAYSGPVFRFQPSDGTAPQPREFLQAGVEMIGGRDAEQAEAEVLMLTVNALKAAGLTDFRLRFGDLGLFKSLLESIDMPDHWRLRLQQNFWRPEAFAALLRQLTTGSIAHLPTDVSDIVRTLDPDMTVAEAEERVAQHLRHQGIRVVGTRTVAEVAAQLLSYAADQKSPPLEPEAAQLIEHFLGIVGRTKAVGARIADMAASSDLALGPAIDAFTRRFGIMKDAGLDLAQCEFSTVFGRNLEYYTGFVFQAYVPGFDRQGEVAGGGRYDNLLAAIGAPRSVPAVGVAIHTERLQRVIAEISE